MKAEAKISILKQIHDHGVATYAPSCSGKKQLLEMVLSLQAQGYLDQRPIIIPENVEKALTHINEGSLPDMVQRFEYFLTPKAIELLEKQGNGFTP